MRRHGTIFNADQLRVARRERRLTQAELGVEVGVHRITVARWEAGVFEPSEEQIDKIAYACRTPKMFFLGEAAEALSMEDPAWLMDPYLSMFPLTELQHLTASALHGLEKPASEIAQAARLPVRRVELLLKGELPTGRELQRLRDAFGSRFNPTTKQPRSQMVQQDKERPGSTILVEEKLDILLQRVARLESSLGQMNGVIDQIQNAVLLMADRVLAPSPSKARMAGNTATP
jgi:transcriptional regulator with XRE-family HTH domain